MNDNDWMREAIKEAAKGGWAVHPNPMVGAVIVKNGKEIGRGYHHGAGQPHAEVMALRDVSAHGETPDGADIYVTLEPCNHFGRTPPCTEALIKAGIKRCFVGTLDADKRVRGAGIARLQDAGIECSVGHFEDELLDLNAAFFLRTGHGRPFVTCKWAMTADGRTASSAGSSQWITGPEARRDVHRSRAEHDAIMAGTSTVVMDNPQLSVRLDGNWRQPVRIIPDRALRIPMTHHVFNTENQKTILFTSRTDADFRPYIDRGVSVETVGLVHGTAMLDIDEILHILADKYTITTLYCEGGAALHGSLFDAGCIDAVNIYMAPKIVGGEHARGCIGGIGAERMADARQFVTQSVTMLGNDIKIAGRIKHCHPANHCH